MGRFLTVFALLVAGCATQAGYQRRMDSWMGANEIDAIRSWGPPSQTYETGGHRFLSYARGGNVTLPGVAPNYTATTFGNTTYMQPSGGMPA